MLLHFESTEKCCKHISKLGHALNCTHLGVTLSRPLHFKVCNYVKDQEAKY